MGVHHFETSPNQSMFQSKNPTFDNGVETTDFGIFSPEWCCSLQSDLPGLTGTVAYIRYSREDFNGLEQCWQDLSVLCSQKTSISVISACLWPKEASRRL